MEPVIIVTLVNLTLRAHITTVFCTGLERARRCVAEFESSYQGGDYRIVVDPPLAELEKSAEVKAAQERDAVFYEAYIQSRMMRPHNNMT